MRSTQKPRRPKTFLLPFAAFAIGLLAMASSASAASFATLQGQSKGSPTWVSGNLSSWEELDPIPMRVQIDPASGDVNHVSTVTIEYDHTKAKGGSIYQGLDRPRNFAVASGDESKVECLNCSNPVRSEPTGSDTWSVSFQVRPLVAAKSAITFTARLRAGAHYFTGSSLALSGTANPGGGLGVLQVSKPLPKSGSPDLQLTKTGPAVTSPGSTISYTLNYRNSSLATSVATGIQLTDTLPSGITYASGCVVPACSVSADGRTLVWDLGDVEIGTGGSVTFLATVGSLPYGTVTTNSAEINSAENDANFTDNRASASTEIRFNRTPVADAQSAFTPEETATTITLSGSDPDGDSLSYEITSLPAHGSLYEGAGVLGTHIVSVGYALSGNQVTYLPDPNHNGPDSFTFATSDGSLDSSSATVSLSVTPVNDPPVAGDVSDLTTPEDSSAATVDVRALVTDVETADANLTYAIVSGPSHGSVTAGATNGTFDYTPDPDYNGPDSFSYEVTDRGDPDNCGSPSAGCDGSKSGQATVSLTIAPVNDTPSAASTPASTSLPEDSQATITLEGSDTETAASDLQFTITALPAHGTLSRDGATLAGNDSFTGSPANVVYTPDPNYNGADSFSFKVNDGSADSNAVDVPLTVTPVNDAPSAADDHSPATTEDGTPVTVDLRPLVSDVETDDTNLAYTIVSGPSHGSIAPGTTNGTFDYAPDADYNGSDSFSYKVTDRGDPDNCAGPSGDSCAGGMDSETRNVPITVTPVNDAPSATSTPTSPTLEEDSETTIELHGSDAETAAADLVLEITDLPAHGTLSRAGTPLAAGDSFTGSPKDVAYTPDANYNGSDSFTYKVTDRGDPDDCGGAAADCAAAESDERTVQLSVTPMNDAPRSASAPASPKLPENGQATIALEGSDTETANSNLTFAIAELPAHGTLSRNGVPLATNDSFTGSPKDVVYSPGAGYHGPDSFSFEVIDRGDPDNCGSPSASCDGVETDRKTVSLEVTAALPAPSTPVTPPAATISRPVEIVPIDQIAKLPRRCASRRHFRIRLRAPRGEQLVKAEVFVNGRQVRVVSGRRLTAPVDLRGLPKGRFKVKILVTTASGRQLAGTRRYRTCTPRLAARKHKRPPKL